MNINHTESRLMKSSTSICRKSRQIASAGLTKLLTIAFVCALVGMNVNNATAQMLLVSVDGNGSNIRSFNPTTGALLSATFITGQQSPYQMATEAGRIYTAQITTGSNVGIYSDTGSSLGSIATSARPIGVAVSGTNLYVAGFATNTVARHNASTGALLNANFITGFSGLRNLQVDGSGNIFVAAFGGTNNVTKWDSAGVAVAGFTTINLASAIGLALNGNDLFVSNLNTTVSRYNATTGALLNASFVTGLSSAAGMEVLNNTLYVASYGVGRVGTYNATTGAAINATFITGLGNPTDVMFVIPEPSTSLMLMLGGLALMLRQRHRAARV